MSEQEEGQIIDSVDVTHHNNDVNSHVADGTAGGSGGGAGREKRRAAPTNLREK